VRVAPVAGAVVKVTVEPEIEMSVTVAAAVVV
jgi:hypothetical protein